MRGICGGHSGTGPGFAPTTYIYPVKTHRQWSILTTHPSTTDVVHVIYVSYTSLSLSLFFSVSLSIEITSNWYTASYSYVIAIMSIHTLILKVRTTYVGMQWRKVLSNFTKVFYSSAPQTLQCQMELSISDIYVLGEKNMVRENSQNEQMLTILCWFVSHA